MGQWGNHCRAWFPTKEWRSLSRSEMEACPSAFKKLSFSCPKHGRAVHDGTGVEGLSGPDAKVALYEGEGGQRGVVCTQGLRKGETVVRIPLKLAVTDYPEDEESNEVCLI
jgi:hypothetical protein